MLKSDLEFHPMNNLPPKPRVLIFVVAYHAESTIGDVLRRIPHALAQQVDFEVLIIDDSSKDRTFETGLAAARSDQFPFKIRVLFNPVNQGYGGNQKIGYHYAIENGFDFVALVHGDGQYAPECLGTLLEPLLQGRADAVFGSRMLTRGAARAGGMPLYKYVGNKILTWIENRLLRTSLSEFHSGYRLYSVKALASVPFDLNTNDFHFDTEIIVQFVFAGLKIHELPIPTYYGDEICRVNGMKYALDVVRAVVRAKAQSAGILYAPNFDCAHKGNEQYQLKLDFRSPHSEVLRLVKPGAKVLDLGCAGGYVGKLLEERLGCSVTGVDFFPLGPGVTLDRFIQHDLNAGLPKLDAAGFDYVLLLDVIEHLTRPEDFVRSLRAALEQNPNLQVIASTGNIGFIIPRLMLLLGQFNYGKRGILDLTHTRLFTFSTFRRLFVQNGFAVESVAAMPAPFPLAVGRGALGRLLLRLNEFAIHFSKGLFGYQTLMVARPLPSLPYLLAHSIEQSEIRARNVEHVKQAEAAG